MVQKMEMMYEGKAKKIFRTDDPDLVWIEYKDDATAFNGLKKASIMGKGELNNKISAHFFEVLAGKGINSHFLEIRSNTEQLAKVLKIIPLEVVVRNIAAGSLAKRLGLEEGIFLKQTVLEWYYKDDSLGDPMINEYHIAALELASRGQVDYIARTALKVNDILVPYLKDKEIDLVDIKLEFGVHKGAILLGDEISPDTCRFWDTKTKEKLDKDRFRRDLGHVEDAYREILQRLQNK
ncbi:MAG: phosphoribosylaminoimidazolesuccinocarboxamide synthase [Bacillota bacterium]|jgi:phosphoribosylaminoimidazole-succinocarboxamide synthase